MMVGLVACASAPKMNQDSVSTEIARQWLKANCSFGFREVSGEVLIKANTKEFKGRYPATLRVEASGKFILEVTNILGGTMAQIQSDGVSMDVLVPSKPNQTRKGIKQYLGLDRETLAQFLLGDLPCAKEWNRNGMGSSDGKIVVQAPPLTWTYTRAVKEDGEKPVQLLLRSSASQVILTVEEWDAQAKFAKKARIQGPDGDLEWTWRSRSP